jgi:hypothetical protein
MSEKKYVDYEVTMLLDRNDGDWATAIFRVTEEEYEKLKVLIQEVRKIPDCNFVFKGGFRNKEQYYKDIFTLYGEIVGEKFLTVLSDKILYSFNWDDDVTDFIHSMGWVKIEKIIQERISEVEEYIS